MQAPCRWHLMPAAARVLNICSRRRWEVGFVPRPPYRRRLQSRYGIDIVTDTFRCSVCRSISLVHIYSSAAVSDSHLLTAFLNSWLIFPIMWECLILLHPHHLHGRIEFLYRLCVSLCFIEILGSIHNLDVALYRNFSDRMVIVESRFHPFYRPRRLLGRVEV
jgi:hypothetical protein